MIIEPFSITELGIFVGTCCASLGGLFLAIKNSRCTSIKCCCINCDRDVLQDVLQSDDTQLTPK